MSTHARSTSISSLVLACLFIAITAHAQSTASGVSPQQIQHEENFRSQISAENLGTYIKTMSARPNYPGAPFAEELAGQTLQLFKKWGWDAKIETFTAIFPRATEQTVELLGSDRSEKYVAHIHEPPVKGDPYTDNQKEILQPQFVYGPDGDVTAPLVYVNFGLRDDYRELEQLGVSVKGKILIARIGGMWRGGKVQLAFEHGASAILIYSDPKEDGYFRDDTYPVGSGRTPDGVQRGSVLYGKYPGDPLTPATPATAGAKRLPKDSPENTLARIPAIPLSYSDAQHLLSSLGGQVVPESWRGALPITYRVGPSTAMVHMKVKYDWKLISWRDVIATLPGTTWPEELVIRANHRDGWVYGAQDPHSGHSSMLEEARVLGQLYRDGWRPKRTILYASWEGEEQGLIGSTEWTEAHRQQLLDHAMLYMNTDTLGQGTLIGTGSSSLSDLASSIASGIEDTGNKISILDRARIAATNSVYETNSSTGSGSPLRARTFDFPNNRLILGPPGYSSDHQAFVSDLGVTTLNLGFGGEGSVGGSYHTSYDDFSYYTRFIDPGFKFGRIAAQLNGSVVLRFADADLLPMNFEPTAEAVQRETSALTHLYAQLVDQAKTVDAAIDSNAYSILQDPRRPIVPPTRMPIPSLDLQPIEQAAVTIDASAHSFSKARGAMPANPTPAQVQAINHAMTEVERAFRRPTGLPGRPFYKNELYSPGRLWDTVPVPAVGDAMLDSQWDEARRQIPLAAATLLGIAKALDAATAEIVQVTPQSK